ncbi:YegS/Rv2252/BmrU family lipid kinase [bacterium]|nr:YegS/Rv2252/BmrU family lipid kinase [bacterium]
MPAKIRVIVNRKARSGCKRNLLERLSRALSGLDFEIVVPESYDDLVAAARSAPQDGVETVVVVGGDGTVNIVLNELAHTPVRLAIVPAGTANDLARQLGIPLGLERACARIRDGKPQVLDLIDVNGRLFVTAGGIGVVSDTAVGVNRLKAKPGLLSKTVRRLGALVYVLYSFGLLAGSRSIVSDLEMAIDGEDHGQIPTIALFVNNQPSLGKLVVPYPSARPDDGRLGVCVMARRSRLGAILTVILMSLGGAHTRRKEIRLIEGESLAVTSPVPKTFIGDGEVLAHADAFALRVVPRALHVLA